jgi:SAM-dependent methyltransferase
MDKEQYDILFRMEEQHWWYLGMQRMVGSLLSRYLAQGRSARILDAGCGTGGMLKYLSRFGPVAGVDLAPEAIDLCRKRDITTIARASVERLPFASDLFDMVVSLDVLYHRAVLNDRLALEEFYRVLRPGGLLLIRVPAYDWLRGAHDVAVHTRHRYSRGELAAKLANAGFRTRKLTYVDSLLFPLAALKRLVEGTNHYLRPDLALPAAPINRLLLGALEIETVLLRALSFPWGLSLMSVATKPLAVTHQQSALGDCLQESEQDEQDTKDMQPMGRGPNADG